MLDTAIKLLNKITDNGYEAYLVGGFVRDYLLDIKSSDVDVTTSATPKELMGIFNDACLPTNEYGSVTVMYNNTRFEITTFRKEQTYKDNRHPEEIIYIKNLNEDLLRRDFTINAICMDKDKNIIDQLNGRQDLEKKEIHTIKDANTVFSDDALRILRAVRFATTLDFTIGSLEKNAIIENKYLLDTLSMERKKQELDKIFSSSNAIKGINLLKELELDSILKLNNLSKVKPCSQLIGIWTQLAVDNIYPFSNNEKDLMENIRKVLNSSPLNSLTLYECGLYPSVVAGELMGYSNKEINEAYLELPIHKQSDLDVTTEEILNYLEKEAGCFLKPLYDYLIKAVLTKKIENDKKQILKMCKYYVEEEYNESR